MSRNTGVQRSYRGSQIQTDRLLAANISIELPSARCKVRLEIEISPKKTITKQHNKRTSILALPLVKPAKGFSYINLKGQPLLNHSK